LHAVDEDAPCILAIEPSALVDVSRWGIAPFAGVRWREDLVAFAADRL